MLIKNAMLLRQKYRVPGNKVRLSPFLLGVHPQNRAGAHMSGNRVLELFKYLLEKGFDQEEADCGGVCVQSAEVEAFNINMCRGDSNLLPTVGAHKMSYGTLSHSHLNQVLKNILAGWAIDPEEVRKQKAFAKVVGPDGHEFKRSQTTCDAN